MSSHLENVLYFASQNYIKNIVIILITTVVYILVYYGENGVKSKNLKTKYAAVFPKSSLIEIVIKIIVILYLQIVFIMYISLNENFDGKLLLKWIVDPFMTISYKNKEVENASKMMIYHLLVLFAIRIYDIMTIKLYNPVIDLFIYINNAQLHPYFRNSNNFSKLNITIIII